MFLQYLSDRNYEEKFWAFILRFETLAAGVVSEASKKIGGATDADARNFFESCFAKCFDVGAGVVPNDWWSRVELPSAKWYCDYLASELPYMIAEARRLAAEKSQQKSAVAPSSADADQINRSKVRELARQSAAFQAFLLETRNPSNPPRSDGAATKNN